MRVYVPLGTPLKLPPLYADFYLKGTLLSLQAHGTTEPLHIDGDIADDVQGTMFHNPWSPADLDFQKAEQWRQ